MEGASSEEIIQLKDQFYVLATSALADQRTRVLRGGESFGVFDVYGNIQPIGSGVQGLYDGATRFLSYFDLSMSGVHPLLLSSTVKSDNTLLTVDMMNRGGDEPGGHEALSGTLHIFRSKFLWNRVVYERLRIANFGSKPVPLTVTYRYKADFADIFEIRGTKRARRGEFLPPEISEDSVLIGYRGLDGVIRRTRVKASPKPSRISEQALSFRTIVEPREKKTLFLSVACEYERASTAVAVPSYRAAYARMNQAHLQERGNDTLIQTSNAQFNQWLERSYADLHLMISRTPYGPYPYAGVPLFNTIFGRDGLIAALQALWVNPEIARGVLAYLASTQATSAQDDQDAEPGKILHEVRAGEMVTLGEVPFRRYYGSADSTPMFLILAGEYLERTGDRDFIRSIWPNLHHAALWLEKWGDIDGDRFVEYQRRNPKGLQNQGWKDSFDSVFHDDGRLADTPIALCEIQAYAYAARLKTAAIADVFGEARWAAELRAKAESLRQAFESTFWCEKISTYALALDRDKRQCAIRSSNAGHALFGGIASPERAWRVALTLLGTKMFSGWGVRTIASCEPRYNPMSYHDGSIWPHDNALIVDGLCRYGFKDMANRIFVSLFEAALAMDQYRLPELFCGFLRRPGEGPTLYPVACSPQAWASGSVLMMLKSVLGLSLHAATKQVRFYYPELPQCLDWVRLKNLRVADGSVDLQIERHSHGVGVTVLEKRGAIEINLIK